ncbi:MAG TPA: UDP-glucose 4-epimerase GalE, partial [Vicinamibacterales bacterium]
LEALERGAPSDAFNVATGTPQSVKSVIDTVGRVVGRPVAWQSAARRPGDPAVLYAAADRARNELGWRPNYTDLEVIVRHAWQWHSRHPDGYRGTSQPTP